jgi:hypothetical protein
VPDTTVSDAARLMGRRGGLKGGRARADKLSPRRRSAIARLGAEKVNAALAELEPEARASIIMRKRTYSSYLDGRRWSGRDINPYKARGFQAALRLAWLIGDREVAAGASHPVTFTRWLWPLTPRDRRRRFLEEDK